MLPATRVLHELRWSGVAPFVLLVRTYKLIHCVLILIPRRRMHTQMRDSPLGSKWLRRTSSPALYTLPESPGVLLLSHYKLRNLNGCLLYPPEVRRGGVLGIGSIPVAVLPSCQNMKKYCIIFAQICKEIHQGSTEAAIHPLAIIGQYNSIGKSCILLLLVS